MSMSCSITSTVIVGSRRLMRPAIICDSAGEKPAGGSARGRAGRRAGGGDERAARARPYGERHVVHSEEPAERLRDAPELERVWVNQRAAFHLALWGSRLNAPSTPRGANRMTPI